MSFQPADPCIADQREAIALAVLRAGVSSVLHPTL